MRTSRDQKIQLSVLTFLLVAVAALAAADVDGRAIDPDMAVMGIPEELGLLQRPAVEFPHQRHVEALKGESCEKCHEKNDKGFQPVVIWAAPASESRDDLMNGYHEGCTGCHKERVAQGEAAGPVTCGECHVRHRSGESARVAMFFDYSLHARHALAYPEKCDTCHHRYDEATEKLVYEKGKEDSCGDCHEEARVESTPSLREASHTACVRCHLARAEQELEAGPSACAGCHDAASQMAFKKLEEIPRLVRGQPDDLWVQAAGGTSRAVAFHHLGHEPLTSSCSICHHKTVKACTDCHTLTGAPEGEGITTLSSYHLATSERSCMGCHAATAATGQCAGCHDRLVGSQSSAACQRCHDGPMPGEEALESPPLPPVRAVLQPLPAYSEEAFPEQVIIDSLVDDYGKSVMPHGKIVTRLDSVVRESGLAAHFHGETELLCSGCHHRTPVGTRPPPCRSCHGSVAAATTDKPALKAAYHRQCIGCHQQMGIKQGCSDCHERLENAPEDQKEVEG